MWTSPCSGMRRRLSLAALCFQMLIRIVEPKTMHRPFNNTIPAFFVFGDSTVDSGNNNQILTIMRSNFRPYGSDFPGHVPTGRFSDGRLVTDFIASYTGVKENVPPYLQPQLALEDLVTGVSFASAGSGFSPETARVFNVINMKEQLEYFRAYKRELKRKISAEKANDLVKKSIFIVSAGTNDLIMDYYLAAIRNQTADIYLKMLIGNAKKFLRDLKKEGVRNVAIVGLVPIGCVPLILTLNPIRNGSCVESISSVAKQFNAMLFKLAKTVNSRSFRVVAADIYEPFEKMIKTPTVFGFEKVDQGCCGTGRVELTYLCNRVSVICKNPKKYVFFDSIHPTEATYTQLFKALRPTIDKVIKIFST